MIYPLSKNNKTYYQKKDKFYVANEKKFMYIKSSNALVAESVDAADLKSVGIYPVPVQVWPSAPLKSSPCESFFLLFICLKK